MPSVTILLASDDETLLQSVGSALTTVRDCRLSAVSSAGDPLEFARSSETRLLIYHATSGDSESRVHAALNQIAEEKWLLPVLVISDNESPGQALRALRAGAVDWLSRPLDLRRLAFLINTLTLRSRFSLPVSEQSATVADGSVAGADSHDLFGCHDEKHSVAAKRLRKVAAYDLTVLLTGETGVGKTRMARMIHEMSPRRDAPFLVVNGAALPEQLLESELFGHRKGAFTGADSDRTGKFAAAGQGTLLLDEVDSLPLAAQAKLLRVVDERLFEPVGSNKTTECQARLIVATNRNLVAEVQDGHFRSDLYYRLNVASFQLPPLRERPAAIATIAEHFLEEFAGRAQMPQPHLSSETMMLMERYSWPGNVRELRNAMERAVALCLDEVIYPEDLPENIAATADGPPPARHNRGSIAPAAMASSPTGGSPASGDAAGKNEFFDPTDSTIRRLNPSLGDLGMARVKGEVDYILATLARCNNNRSQAAQELGISRTALYKKLHQFGMIKTSQS